MTRTSGRDEVVRLRGSDTKVVTVQPLAVWERLRRDKCLFVDPAHPDFYGIKYPTAYDWLREQMRQRLDRYEGHYPWWAWMGREPKCMMKGAWVYGDGETLVRLELSIAPGRLVVSEFSAWHHPLNGTYLPLSSADAEAWESECEAHTGPSFSRLAELPLDLRVRVRLSWGRCLDPTAMEASEFFKRGVYQAAFEVLRLEDVTKMTRFRRRLRTEPYLNQPR